jgi:hypothetical protein
MFMQHGAVRIRTGPFTIVDSRHVTRLGAPARCSCASHSRQNLSVGAAYVRFVALLRFLSLALNIVLSFASSTQSGSDLHD